MIPVASDIVGLSARDRQMTDAWPDLKYDGDPKPVLNRDNLDSNTQYNLGIDSHQLEQPRRVSGTLAQKSRGGRNTE